jgi:hypothetical protein
MKKYFIAGLLILFISGMTAAQVGPGRTMYVSVKTVDLKASTGTFASSKGTLAYGDQVTVIQADNKFAEVKSDANPSLSGWVALTNLTTRKIVTGSSPSATVNEVALASKGFNQENQSADGREEVDYAKVDKVEAFMVDIRDLLQFIKEGGLTAVVEQ